MARIWILWLGGLVALCAGHGVFMDKLSSKKLCADEECVYTISLAKAQEDYNAPDCRFINIKKGQQIYVYSKLVKENGAGEFWAGSHLEDFRQVQDYRKRSNVQVVRQIRSASPKDRHTSPGAASESQICSEFPGMHSEKEALAHGIFIMRKKFLKSPDINLSLTVAVLGTQVYSDHQDEMGIVGYFPSNLVKEQRVYQEATKEVPTTEIDFFCE